MSGNTRTIVTIIAVLCIAGAIIFLEMHRVGPRAALAGSADVSLATSTPEGQNVNAGPVLPYADRVAQKKKEYDVAKELMRTTGFVNTDPFTIQSLIGKKVILVDFWTYSCINCIRTLPYVEAWYEKYKDAGFVVVGVHTPEFDFEKILANVQAAVKKFGITYPVVLDSDYGTWSAYGNQYWPHEYLIDIDGFIAHDHIGEGEYADTEQEIQKLLQERKDALGLSVTIPTGTVNPGAPTVNEKMPLSPETYFGSARSEGNFTLKGNWKTESQFIETTQKGASLTYDYEAQNVYFVAAGPGKGAKVTVLIDGKPIPASLRGDDVDATGHLMVSENRLYSVVKDAAWAKHTLQLILESGDLQAFTFTFG